MASLVGIMKDFVSHFLTMFSFCTPFGFLMFSGSIKGEETIQAFWFISAQCFSSVPSWERQKTLGLLLFPGGIKLEHWEEIGEIISYLS